MGLHCMRGRRQSVSIEELIWHLPLQQQQQKQTAPTPFFQECRLHAHDNAPVKHPCTSPFTTVQKSRTRSDLSSHSPTQPLFGRAASTHQGLCMMAKTMRYFVVCIWADQVDQLTRNIPLTTELRFPLSRDLQRPSGRLHY